MYISKICFKNFRCFGPEETVLHLEPDLTFFVGNNGTGKSKSSDFVRLILQKWYRAFNPAISSPCI